MELKFYICEHCGNIVTKLKDSGVPVVCCGQPMKELIAGATEAAVEKHVPVYEVEGNTVAVTVSSVEHPMIPEHFIEWICLETSEGIQVKHLSLNEPPKASFAISEGEEVVAVYAYCNLHSLWKSA